MVHGLPQEDRSLPVFAVDMVLMYAVIGASTSRDNRLLSLKARYPLQSVDRRKQTTE